MKYKLKGFSVSNPVATTTTMAQQFPTIDGHFWIERDGEIIDDDFIEYDYIKHVQKCSGKKIYKEADALTQTIITKMFNRVLESHGFNYEKFRAFSKKHGLDKSEVNCCFQNSIYKLREGDVLKFGSMGWKRQNAPDIYWEFGGEDWVGAKRFLK